MPDDLSDHLCSFKSHAGQECEDDFCRADMPEGSAVYYFSGGAGPFAGRYVCGTCAIMWVHDKAKIGAGER